MPTSFVEVTQKQDHKGAVFWQDDRFSQLFRETSDIFKSTMRTKKAIFILLCYQFLIQPVFVDVKLTPLQKMGLGSLQFLN